MVSGCFFRGSGMDFDGSRVVLLEIGELWKPDWSSGGPGDAQKRKL